MRPDPFQGPFLPDFVLALAGIPTGNLVGYWVGAVVQIFRDVKMSDYVLHGGGYVGTFTVGLVLFSRI
jgi:hypothetical protein